MKTSRSVSGIFIFLAMIMTLDHFVVFDLLMPSLLLVSTLTFMAGLVAIHYPKVFIGIILSLILIITSVVLVDFGVAYYQRATAGEVTLDETASLWQASTIGRESTIPPAKWLKEEVFEKYGTFFGQWVLYERFSGTSKDHEASKEYEILLVTLFSLSLFVLVQLLLSRLFGHFGAFIPMIFYAIMWYRYIDFPLSVYGFYAFGLILYSMIRHYERLGVLHKLEDQTYYRVFRIWRFVLLGSFMTILLSALIFVAVPFKVIDLTLDSMLPNVWGARTTYNTDQFRLYSLADTSYQNDTNNLGGPVGPRDLQTPLFWLSMDSVPKEAVYLKSQVKRLYNGSQWYNLDQVYYNDFSHYRSIEAHEPFMNPQSMDYIKGTIEYEQIKTVTLLTPMGFYDSNLSSQKVYVSQENQAFYKGGIFVRFIDRYSFEATQRDFTPALESDLLLPEVIDEKTIELGRALGALGKTDKEKIYVMTQFLQQNYTYNLTVPTIRVHPDFVTNFLFEQKSGYCTYYASSLAVLARVNGIPTRYVEGFIVTPDMFEGSKPRAKVTEAYAHAWVEVYFEGEGWRVVEATPPYTGATTTWLGSQIDLGSSPVIVPSEENLLSQPLVGDDEIDLNNYLIDADGGFTRSDSPLSPIPTPAEIEQGEDNQENRQVKLWNTLPYIVILFLIGLLWWRMPAIARFKNTSHSHIVKLIYLYTELLTKTRELTSQEFLATLQLPNTTQYTRQQWSRVLYSRQESITEKELIEALRALRFAFMDEFLVLKQQRGVLYYVWFRLANRY